MSSTDNQSSKSNQPNKPSQYSDSEKPINYFQVILDSSGSMFDYTKDTLGSIRSFHAEQKKDCHPDSKFNVYTFSDKVNQAFSGRLSDNLEFPYHADGCTALYDAIGKGIMDTTNYLSTCSDNTRPSKIFVIILTDGFENSSHKFNKSSVGELIESQKKNGWEFVYLAANQDAFQSGEQIGISRDSCLNYNQNKNSTNGALRSISQAVKRCRSTNCSVSFTADERAMSQQVD